MTHANGAKCRSTRQELTLSEGEANGAECRPTRRNCPSPDGNLRRPAQAAAGLRRAGAGAMDRAPEYRPESSMSDSRNITRRGDAFAADLCRLRARRRMFDWAAAGREHRTATRATAACCRPAVQMDPGSGSTGV